MIDLHCDTLYELKRTHQHLRKNNLMVDLQKLQKSHSILQNFAIFTNLETDDPLTHVSDCIELYYKELEENKDLIAPVYTYQDILNNIKNHKISAILTLEEGAVIDDDISMLQKYYDQGVRMITLSWNYPTSISHPNFDRTHSYSHYNTTQGLTDLGKDYVREMNRLGMIVDVSHLSDQGFYDVASLVEGPFIASHSNARSVCPHVRNLSDDMIKVIAKHNGVIGINFYAPFLRENKTVSKVEDMVKHILYIKELVGIDYISIGSDFDGIDCELEIKDASYMNLLYNALRKYLSEEEIEKIAYKNILRVYKEVLK